MSGFLNTSVLELNSTSRIFVTLMQSVWRSPSELMQDSLWTMVKVGGWSMLQFGSGLGEPWRLWDERGANNLPTTSLNIIRRHITNSCALATCSISTTRTQMFAAMGHNTPQYLNNIYTITLDFSIHHHGKGIVVLHFKSLPHVLLSAVPPSYIRVRATAS